MMRKIVGTLAAVAVAGGTAATASAAVSPGIGSAGAGASVSHASNVGATALRPAISAGCRALDSDWESTLHALRASNLGATISGFDREGVDFARLGQPAAGKVATDIGNVLAYGWPDTSETQVIDHAVTAIGHIKTEVCG
jgi:hypothetical protein